MKKIYLFIIILFLISSNSESKVLTGPSIAGKVLLQGNAYSGAVVTLYQTAPAKQLQTVTTDAGGNYKFFVNGLGNYFMYAEIQDDLNHPNTVGTYYGDKFLWYKADSVIMSTLATITGKNINVIELANPQGDVTVTGNIQTKAGKGVFANLFYVISGSGVLEREVSSDDTNGGFYDFENLHAGTYQILVDTFGVRMDNFYEISPSSGDVVTDLNYVLNGTKISKVVTGVFSTTVNSSGFELYPNPGFDELTVNILSGSATNISMYNVLGEQVYSSSGNYAGTTSVSIGDLPKGVYTLKLLLNESVTQKKFLKE